MTARYTIDCDYEWFRRDEGEGSWTRQPHITPSYGWYHAQPDTFDFELKAKVIRNVAVPIARDADTLTHVFSVSVASDDLDPVSASISGPSFISVGQQNTWYSVVSGGLGTTTYLWERSIQYEGGGYGPWQQVGTSQNYTTTYQNCENFKLRLTATREYPVPGQNDDSAIKTVTVFAQGGECDVIPDPG